MFVSSIHWENTVLSTETRALKPFHTSSSLFSAWAAMPNARHSLPWMCMSRREHRSGAVVRSVPSTRLMSCPLHSSSFLVLWIQNTKSIPAKLGDSFLWRLQAPCVGLFGEHNYSKVPLGKLWFANVLQWCECEKWVGNLLRFEGGRANEAAVAAPCWITAGRQFCWSRDCMCAIGSTISGPDEIVFISPSTNPSPSSATSWVWSMKRWPTGFATGSLQLPPKPTSSQFLNFMPSMPEMPLPNISMLISLTGL